MDFEQTHTKDVTAILPSRTRLLEGLKTPAAGEQNEQNTAKYSKVAFGESPKAFAYFAILLVLLSVFHFCFFCPFCFFCYPYFALPSAEYRDFVTATRRTPCLFVSIRVHSWFFPLFGTVRNPDKPQSLFPTPGTPSDSGGYGHSGRP